MLVLRLFMLAKRVLEYMRRVVFGKKAFLKSNSLKIAVFSSIFY